MGLEYYVFRNRGEELYERLWVELFNLGFFCGIFKGFFFDFVRDDKLGGY